MSCHSSFETSALKEVCIILASDNYLRKGATHLEHVDTLTSNMAEEFILVVEMTAKHLRGLVYSMLNLYSDTSSGLGLLDDLNLDISCEKRL